MTDYVDTTNSDGVELGARDPLIVARAQSRWAATKELIRRHQLEYDELHSSERVKRGLPAKPDRTKVVELEAQNAELRRLLVEHGVEA